VKNQFNNILLEPEQEELLSLIVEAARNTPREERQKFLVLQLDQGDLLHHPGLKKRGDTIIYYGDVEELGRQGLLAIGFGPSGTPNFDVTSLGFRYYEHLKREKGEAVQRIETTMKGYLASTEFRAKYPEAFAKWSSAEDLLWQTDTQQQLTTIGHLCREALQAFATSLVERYQPPDVNTNKSKTVARLKSVLGAAQLGTTKKAFLEALLAYWGTVNDLIQRQEHGAYKDGEQLVWEDGRRVVFQTMITMFEIAKTL
jgi:hypothetical protein